MFSPSAVSMILHSVLPERLARIALEESVPIVFANSREVAGFVRRLTGEFPRDRWVRLPIVGRTTLRLDFELWFRGHVGVDVVKGVTFFWGRVPINLLADHLIEFHESRASEHLVDLGSPVYALHGNLPFDQECHEYLLRSAPTPGQAKVGAAVVDLGKQSTQGPTNYDNLLRHAVNTNIELSDHAKKVLSVLLDRLDSHGILGDTTVSCALVRPPAAMVAAGKSWFGQSNAVEMLDAIMALEAQLTQDNLPAAVNISLGTHIGPHNGDSPIEEYIATKLVRPGERFVVAAAGNDGGSGVAAKRVLVANERDFLSLRTGGPRCNEVLVEFWWDDANGGDLTIEAEIYARPAGGSRGLLGVVKID